jgi:valyl-tRNA synthetase
MLEPVREGKIKIIPDHFEKVYFNWIENLRDWCISRQIWYGHRIPVWYKDKEIFVGLEKTRR